LKALVVYGTRWGGTVSVAEKIGEALKDAGSEVDVVDAKANVPQVDSYDLVVVGSGVRADKWTKETLRFLEKNADALKTKRTALFVSCMMADREGEAREKLPNGTVCMLLRAVFSAGSWISAKATGYLWTLSFGLTGGICGRTG
jgi:menaquinone-dependent protoporphyrinogen IX oxidase